MLHGLIAALLAGGLAGSVDAGPGDDDRDWDGGRGGYSFPNRYDYPPEYRAYSGYGYPDPGYEAYSRGYDDPYRGGPRGYAFADPRAFPDPRVPAPRAFPDPRGFPDSRYADVYYHRGYAGRDPRDVDYAYRRGYPDYSRDRGYASYNNGYNGYNRGYNGYNNGYQSYNDGYRGYNGFHGYSGYNGRSGYAGYNGRGGYADFSDRGFDDDDE